jgi:tellurite resistance protein
MATTVMIAMALAIARWDDFMDRETRKSACAVAMATAALDAFSVSSLNLISTAVDRGH